MGSYQSFSATCANDRYFIFSQISIFLASPYMCKVTDIARSIHVGIGAQNLDVLHDEAQHIFRKKNEAERLAILDSFKTLMKSHDWPLTLIFSGVPELDDYLKEEPQLYRLLNRIQFEDVELPENFETVHQIVGSYAIEANLIIDEPLLSSEFYERLVAAGAYRWGLVIKLTIGAISASRVAGTGHLTREHFIDAWVGKTQTSRAGTPFTHGSYETIYRKDHPFISALAN